LTVSERKIVKIIFVDFKQTFGTIDRKRLEKLYQYGIREMVLE